MSRGRSPYDRREKTASYKSREASRYETHPIRPTEDFDFEWEVRYDGVPIAWFCSTVECSEFIRQHAAQQSENNSTSPIDTDHD